jgi:hypothetical protein
MIDIKRAVLTLLEENGTTFRMRPIDMPMAERLMLALVIPACENNNLLASSDIEILYAKNAITKTKIEVNDWTESADKAYKSEHYELSDPNEFEKFSEYLKEKCSNRLVYVEFSSAESLDFEIA